MVNKVAEVSRINPLFDTRPVLCKQHSTYFVKPPSAADQNLNQNRSHFASALGAQRPFRLQINAFKSVAGNAVDILLLKRLVTPPTHRVSGVMRYAECPL
jgi:hypothetical protein